MDFSQRSSQQHRSQNQSNNGRSRQQQPDESDIFMRLPDKEIAGCINDIGVPCTPEDIQRPNPQHIQKVFEHCAEIILNVTRETVDPAMRAAANDVCGEYSEIVPADTRNLMGFYTSLRKLLAECGIDDFSFSDLLKPEHKRLVKIFSHLINFIRFRESQNEIIDTHFSKAELTKQRIDLLYNDNDRLREHLDKLKRERKSTDASFAAKKAKNDVMTHKLRETYKEQEKTVEKLDRVKAQKSDLGNILKERTANFVVLRQESEKLRPYASQSSAALQTQLQSLSEAHSRTRTSIDSLSARSRALESSSSTFSAITAELALTTKLLQELSLDLKKEEEENLVAARRREALTERGNNVREVERGEALLLRQLARLQERTEGLERRSEEKAEIAKKRMEELRGVKEDVMREGGVKRREVEGRRVRVEVLEKKMADLRENIANEVTAARDEYMKMEAHVRLYITEMEQAIG